MHYRNGREAKPGDKVINLQLGMSGMLHSLSAQSDTCNARLAPVTNNDPYVNLKDCVHVDDVTEKFTPKPEDCGHR